MWDLLSHPVAQAVLAVAILLAAVYFGFKVLGRLRPSIHKADTSVDDLAQNFEEMQLEGDISEAELRRIKAVLGEKPAEESEA